MRGLIDTHAHLTFPDFKEDLDAILDRCKVAGIEKIICIGTTLESSKAALSLAQRYEQIYATVGIHPCSVEESEETTLAQLELLLNQPKVAALGECGLDYHHLPAQRMGQSNLNYADQLLQIKNKQAHYFIKQCELAAQYHLNVVVHERDSWADTLTIIKPFTNRLKAVFHCFGGTCERAAELQVFGHYVSFTGIITFKKSDALRAMIKTLPSGSYMVETDCPYLAPTPFRGKRCEPSHVKLVADTIAQLRPQSEESLREELWETSHQFFRLD